MKPATSFLHAVPGLAEFAANLTPETADERAAREQREQQRERDEVAAASLATREAILRDRGIPAKHRALILAGALDQTPTLERTRSWLADDRRVLALVGPGDAGKTTAASWAAAQEPSPRRPAPVHPAHRSADRRVRAR
jgi:flagellar biosynthesis GTPase FlhF